jgi:hypothetical protein
MIRVRVKHIRFDGTQVAVWVFEDNRWVPYGASSVEREILDALDIDRVPEPDPLDWPEGEYVLVDGTLVIAGE